jgi:hypothetical protein
LNAFQRSELAFPLLEVERELAKQRQLSKLQFVRDKISLPSNGGNDGESVEKVAKKAGVSAKTFERAKKIIVLCDGFLRV